MFDFRPASGKGDELDFDDNSSVLYEDEELERIMATLPERDARGAKKKAKAKSKERGEEKEQQAMKKEEKKET